MPKTQEKNIVLELKPDLDYALNISDNKTRSENAEYIVVGKIKSIDGATNYNEKKNKYTAILTYGQIEIKSVLKGNIKKKEIPFIRLGGEITFDEYEKSLTDSQKEKMKLLSAISDSEKATSYVSYAPNGDISIEEGKYYLMYMSYNADYDKYIIMFFEYGLNEITNPEKINDIDNLNIINNATKKTEPLSNYIGEIKK